MPRKATKKSDLELETLRKQELEDKNSALLLENSRLEQENEELQASIEEKKAAVNTELAVYEDTRKREVKAAILAAYKELKDVKAELAARSSELESIKQQLGELNEVFLQEQEDIKVSNAETRKILDDNREKVATTQSLLDELTLEVKKLEFTRDNALITLEKQKEEHAKFLEYERETRRTLEAKEHELRSRAAEMDGSKKLLKQTRSLLPEL